MSTPVKPGGVIRRRNIVVAGAFLVLTMLLAGCAGDYTADVSFGGFLLGLFYFFLLVIWLWLLITIFADIFRRRDMSGWAKAGWTILIIILPLLGILIYLIARPRDLAQDREEAEAHASAAARVQAGQAVDEIAKAAELHDQGKISDEEFEAIKKKSLS